MKKILFLLKQRRFWAGVVGFIGFIASLCGFDFDSETLTNLLTEVGIALSSLIPAILAIWSLLNPKK